MTRVDLHAHLIPPAYAAELQRVDSREATRLPDWSPELVDELLARYELDAAVFSLSSPGVFFGDQGQTTELARMVNEEAAQLVGSDPARRGALAVLPLPDVEAALAELAHALDVLELDGVALLSNVGGTYLGDPAWDPLFDELDRRGAYLFVHPAPPPYAPPIPYPPALVEFPFDTTRAIVHLIYSGTLERCPNLRAQFAHAGGAAPFLAHRIAWFATRAPDLGERLGEDPLRYLERLYFDTALSANAPAQAAVLELTSADHVVFGSDWPFARLPDEGTPPPAIEGTGAPALAPRLVAARTL